MFANASHNSRTSAIAPVPGRTEVLARITELISDLKPDSADLLKGLHRIQHEFHYIPPDGIPLLAQQLLTTPAIIYGTIDFYSELRLAPPAENVVEWCSGPACRLKNSTGIQRALEAELGCQLDQASVDSRFELRLVQCDGTCNLAPLIRYRGKYLGPLRTSDAIEFARGLKGVAAATSPELQQAHAEVREAAGEIDERGVAGAISPDPGPTGDVATSGLPIEPVAGPRPPLTPDQDPTREPGE